VACSADGSVLVTGGGGGIATSTNLGASWAVTTNYVSPIAIAASADGTKFVAVTYDTGLVYTSTDSGMTWKQATNAPALGLGGWTSVACSADGTKLVASPDYWALHTSADSGATWVSKNTPVREWLSVASSADGSHLIAAAFPTSVLPGGIYTSEDYGTSWRSNNLAPYQWLGVASSADGKKLVAVSKYGPIYTSLDAGYNWTSNSAPSTNFWRAAASSADGNKLAAAVDLGGGIYTLQLTPNPKLDIIKPSLTNVVISWTIPSMSFVMQENPDLTTTNWTDVGATPTSSNFLYEVNLPTTAGSSCFRLISR
jgi:photosystem II stability/assembly factor-like uncharacterized protein